MTTSEMTTTARPGLPPMPARIQRLPRDARGYPVPWFVAWHDGDGHPVRDGHGTPSFPHMNAEKFIAAVKFRLCWVCGQPLGANLVFVIGPMCGINRTTSEPPCHLECAEFSAKACPFLTRPKQRRIDEEGVERSPGFALTRNPGVTLLWTTKRYETFNPHAGGDGVLIQIGDPTQVRWYREARTATRAEILESVDGGMPHLRELAEAEGPKAMAHLARLRADFDRLLPAE